MQYLIFGAEDQVRTGDIQIGNLTLYQLSYSRLNMAERLGVEPSERLLVLQISNLLHYHPAPAPYVLGSTLPSGRFN